MQVIFPNSHAYNRGKAQIEDRTTLTPCLVEFGDGVVVSAEAEDDGADIVLRIPAYRTAKGHEVVARSWRLVESEDGDWRSQGCA